MTQGFKSEASSDKNELEKVESPSFMVTFASRICSNSKIATVQQLSSHNKQNIGTQVKL